MNKGYIKYNLEEGQNQLEQIINELNSNSEYDFEDYIEDMTHLYHHINTAWNARSSTQEQSEKCSESDFMKWRVFPNDIEMSS
jgi:hypothetical protein